MTYEESQKVFQRLIATTHGRNCLEILSRCTQSLGSLDPGGTVSVVYDPPMAGELTDQQRLFTCTLPDVYEQIHLFETQEADV